MVTTKKAGAARRPPARRAANINLVPKDPGPATFAEVALVYLGGPDLSFRDGLDRKRKVLRGQPFTVDAATARILLATDPKVSTVGAWEAEKAAPAPAPIPVPEAVPPAPEPVPEGGPELPADDPAAVVTGEAGTPPMPGAPTGAIVLGDLPPSAVKQR